MSIAANLGFPRIGPRRELKTALEAHWAGRLPEEGLLAEAARLRTDHWRLQQRLGIGHVPSNDFCLYDHVLATACMLGAIPPGYGWSGEGPVSLATEFALARGARGTETERAAGIEPGLPALELTKWFDTNYHYLVPALREDQRFTLTENRPLAAFREALALGIRTRPVLLGPVSFLLLSKAEDGSDPLALLPALLPGYARLLGELAEAGCAWVQMDEPVLATDLTPEARAAFTRAYAALARKPAPSLMLTAYFGGYGDNLDTVLSLPVAGLHLDATRARAEEMDALADGLPEGRLLSLGAVDGRNIWRADLAAALDLLRRAASARPDGARRLVVAPSCSLLHVPVDLAQEDRLDPSLRAWLAFAVQKLEEVRVLALALEEGEAAPLPKRAFAEAGAALAARRASVAVHDPSVAACLAATTPEMASRASPHAERQKAQAARLNLPPLPTTTIGSFPQTEAVRATRAQRARGAIDAAQHDAFMEQAIAESIRWQEEAGLDVLVHGEFERNDMVKHFGELLSGFAFTRHGWVQSYGSRCVAPPIIWGDVSRPAPMTLRWWRHAQSLTDRPVKGMLTGPVTLLQWSFVRDDIPRETVCRQLALAVRDEVLDLEAAGCAIIQIDEPAFREGLPLHRADRDDYLRWAVECFRLSAGGVSNATQIHTHMCYSEFNDIIASIAAMDADVISVETARSRMELLEAFSGFAWPNEIGPGVWDIHSPRVPGAEEMAKLLRLACGRVDVTRLWVNPDCGCKTRNWAEVKPAVAEMVKAARTLRAELLP
jgi:5-methyltetrahydropteroyltriglutamate--homocysteine methyltransferase